MKKLLVFALVVLTLAFVCYSAEYDGYVVKISENAASLLAENVSMFAGASLASDLTDAEAVEFIAEEFSGIKEVSSNQMIVKADSAKALEELIALGIVEDYEENYYLELHGYDVTQNEYYAQQKWYLDYINANFAWNAGIYGEGATVAVIDSGIDEHVDFGNNLLPGKNYVDGLDENDTSDEYNHGTHVAGIIASRCNNLATVGIAFRSKIVPLKVTNGKTFTIDKVITAIEDAVDHFECDVINMSLGDTVPSDLLREAINYAISKKVIVVASAGNKGNSGYAYPAAFDEVVSVANAYNTGNSLLIYSSSQRNDMVDIAAPGTLIPTLLNVSGVTGTSFSAPMVSAVAALAKSINPDITQQEFQSLIKRSADASYLASSGQGSTAWGAGLLDIEAFIKLMLSGEKFYVSKKVTVANEDFVYITNFNDSETECIITLNEYNPDGSPNKTRELVMDIPVSGSVEISLTDYGFSSSATVSVKGMRLPGDINEDGSINVLDASVILKFLAGYPVDVPKSYLNVDGKDDVTLIDASFLLRYCAGHDVELK